MFRLVVIALLLAVCSALDAEAEWRSFTSRFGKSYATEEERRFRRAVFTDNLAMIERHMREYAAGLHSYTIGVTQFCDWTEQEWRLFVSGQVAPPPPPPSAAAARRHRPSGAPPPARRDWREAGAVTPVGNEGQCGSCWAFSTTGTLEGMWKLAGNPLVKLAEQQLMDCSRSYGNYGCNGGWMVASYQYIRDVGGISSAADYPYAGRDQDDSRCANATVAATLSSWVETTAGSEEEMLDACGNVGPLAIVWDASSFKFSMYTGGVFDDPNCGTSAGHSGILVGYDMTEDGKEYWIVKNVWGEQWGDHGYVLMSRNKNNQCGIADKTSYAVV